MRLDINLIFARIAAFGVLWTVRSEQGGQACPSSPLQARLSVVNFGQPPRFQWLVILLGFLI